MRFLFFIIFSLLLIHVDCTTKDDEKLCEKEVKKFCADHRKKGDLKQQLANILKNDKRAGQCFDDACGGKRRKRDVREDCRWISINKATGFCWMKNFLRYV